MSHFLTKVRLGLVLLGMLVSGCMGLAGGGARLDYEGKEAGSHADQTNCDADGTLTGSGSVSDGQVSLRVTDGSGNELYAKTFSSDFTLSGEKLTGASGTWKMEATRGGNDLVGDSFSGHYAFRLAC